MTADVDLGRCLAAILRGEGVPAEGLPGGTDLRDLAVAAGKHRVAPLLLQALRGTGQPVPHDFETALRHDTETVARRNLRRWRALAGVVEVLGEHRVPVIVLKGACLAETVYGNVALRPMRDLDLLVPLDRLDEVDAVFRGIGLRPGPWNGEYYRRTHYHYLYRDERGEAIEVHWHVATAARAARIDIGAVWARSLPAAIAGHQVRVLCAEDLFLHLAMHLAMHDLGMGLLAVADLDALLRRAGAGMDWDALFSRAREWGVLRAAQVALLFAHQLLNAPVPAVVLEREVLPAIPRSVAGAAVRQVLSVTATTRPEEKNPNIRRLAAAPSVLHKVRVLARTVFAPRDMVGQCYDIDANSPLIWPAYARRIVDLAGKHGGEIVRRARRGQASAAEAREMESLLDWLAGC